MLHLCPYLNFLPFYLYMFMIGRVSNPGSTALIMCVNPLPNFIIGYIVLGSLLVIAVPYIFMGRFHKIAHKRERGALVYVKKCSEELQQRIKGRKAIVEDLRASEASNEDSDTLGCYNRLLWLALYLLLSTLITFIAVTLVYAVFVTRVLYSAMIIVRELDLRHLGVQRLYDVIDAVAHKLNFLWIDEIVYPFAVAIEHLGSFSIDLGSIEVTCQGSQAPVEILVNSAVL